MVSPLPRERHSAKVESRMLAFLKTYSRVPRRRQVALRLISVLPKLDTAGFPSRSALLPSAHINLCASDGTVPEMTGCRQSTSVSFEHPHVSYSPFDG